MKKDFHRSEKAFSSRWKKFFTPMEKEENHEELSIRRIDNSQLPAYLIDNLQCNQRIIKAIDF